jgi:molybdopterin molybdotransferase
MISVAEALARILALGTPLPTERVPLRAAAGRVLAAPVIASRDQPPFDASAMDGYAIREADHRPGVRLTVIGEAGAGHAFTDAVGAGEAARIFTGAPVPDGADRVVIQEDVTRDGNRITLGDRLETQSNIRGLGNDFKVGDRLPAPRRLRPADLGLIAAMNVPEVTVTRRPVVAILSTGDELVMPGGNPRPDQIIASNAIMLAAMAEGAGAEVRVLPIARDTPDSLRFTFGLAADADVLVTIGGASVGDHDLVGRIATELGFEQAFWKIAMRPGKPLMAGRLGGSIMLGLPGNPVSAFVCAQLFLLPLLSHIQGIERQCSSEMARLLDPLPANGPRAHYMRARLGIAYGQPTIAPMGSQDSSLMTVLGSADALLVRPVGDGARAAGELVEFIRI